MPELDGLGILVTRPAHQAEHLAQLIETAGGRAILFPVLEILDPLDSAPLLHAIDHLDEFDIAIFISANAVERCMNLIRSRRELPTALKLAAVGQASAKALHRCGRAPDIVPAHRFDSEALLATPALRDVRGRRIVIFRGDGGRELLGDELRARGARVQYVECYRRAKPHADTSALLHRWARGEIDIVTVTSVQGLRHLFDLVGDLGRRWLVKTPIVVVSERMAPVCRELGCKADIVVAERASDEAIVAAIRAWRGT